MKDICIFHVLTIFLIFLTISSKSNQDQESIAEMSCDTGIADACRNCSAPRPDSELYSLPSKEQRVFLPSRLNVDMFLNETCTKEYLGSIENDFQRLIVRKTLLACPFTKLCHFSLGWSPLPSWPFQQGPCCSGCSCTAGCETERTCCPDYHSLQLDITREPKVEETCMKAEMKPGGGTFSWDRRIRAYQTCPRQADADVQFMCSGDFKSFSNIEPEDVVPLSDIDSAKTYRNIHCARCHHIDTSMLQPWTLKVVCKQKPKFTLTGKLIKLVLDGILPCDIQFLPPEGAKIEYCGRVISDCNVTGLWERFDLVTYSACRLYGTIIQGEHNYRPLYFKNPFCATCNGINPNSYKCSTFQSMAPLPPTVYSFSQLLRVDPPNKQDSSEKIICGKKSLYDDITVSTEASLTNNNTDANYNSPSEK